MRISRLGHSSFLIVTDNGTRIITDPFNPASVGYAAPELACDIVICSHGHSDHAYLEGVESYSHAINGAGTYQADGVKISGTVCNHDPEGGRLRGKNAINLI